MDWLINQTQKKPYAKNGKAYVKNITKIAIQFDWRLYNQK